MNRIDFYLSALRDQAFLLNAWTLSVFTEILEEEDAWLSDPYHYRVVRKEGKAYFVNKTGSLELIDDVKGNDPILPLNTPLDLKPGDLINVDRPVKTTVSEAFMNAAVLCYPFGNFFPYKEGKWDAGYVEEMTQKHLVSDPLPGEDPKPGTMSVSQLEKVSQVLLGLTALNAYFVPTASPRNITFDPEMIKLRDKRIKELEESGKINDPIELAKMEKELEAMDRAYCNDYGKTFFTEAKEFNNARKKMFLHVGYEKDFLDDGKGKYNKKSLAEGINLEMFAETVNGSREGSYNRGRLTMLGGADVKSAIRSTQNRRVVTGFCGTNLGIRTKVYRWSFDMLNGFYYLVKGKAPVEITNENFPSLVGKIIEVASPGFCREGFTDVCSICIGKAGASRPNALPLNITDISSANMYKFMKKMHVTSIQLTELVLDRTILR